MSDELIPKTQTKVESESSISKYLDSAKKVLDKFGLLERPTVESQLSNLLQDAAEIDTPKTTAIMRVVQYMGTFNELVRDKIEEQKFGNRYEPIIENFNTIREDTAKLVGQAEKEKVSFGEKVGYKWMKITRGTPHSRFNKIRKLFQDVSNDTKDQLDREEEIMNAYFDFRFALKGASNVSAELLQEQEKRLEKAKSDLQVKQNAVTDYKGDQAAEKGKLELARDESHREFTKQDKLYQLVKDVSECLSNGYQVGELAVTRLEQSHNVKDQLYRRGVTFFSLNEHVYTVMDATYASLFGVAEARKTQDAMVDGTRKCLEQISDIGGKIMEAGLKTGYGSTYDLPTIKKFADSIVDFQKRSFELIEQGRKESSESAKQIADAVNDAKRRYTEVIDKHSAGNLK